MNEQKIACPNCKNEIIFDVYALIQGSSFACSQCNAKIQLAGESKETVTESIEEFEKLKQNVLQKNN